ncbi:MAG: hypothetical protein C6Y22_11415, partial [Hapalosiphonaceae cyanobacterium JJU2]
MSLTELLKNLLATGIELWVDGDELCYEAPEDVLTPELLTQIKQYKPEIIRILSQGSDHASTYPLSHGQKAVWFLYQLAPTSTAYNATYAAKLVTNLDTSALKQAAQVLVERHPVLRTTFTTIDGEPVQTVHENQQVDFSIEEVFHWNQDHVNNWLSETSDRPFDLEQGPILRFNLLIHHTTTDTLTTKEHVLLITVHHIVVDFWSLEIIVSELRNLYAAITTGVAAQLPVQNCQYRDYVNWSEQMLTTSEGERLSSYWQQQLSGELPLLNLPTDRPRPENQTYNGASHFFTVEEKLLQKLAELAKNEGASLYTVILTTLQILLLRYTNQEDILIGSPMVNRSRSEFEKIVGYFTNPVVLRADLKGNPTFQELLGRSRLSVLNALDHQDYPFPLLVERLQPVRDPSFSPLYQVALAWDRSHQSDQEVSLMDSDGLIVESMIPKTKGAALDLTLTILDVPGSLKGTWNYNTDLFDASTIERMAGHFVTLLEAIVANPQQHICQLPLLTESEQQQILVEWNNTQADYPIDKCIHQLFEEQVARNSNAVAVVYENKQLTYHELNCRANQLANYLRSKGVGPDVLVGICVERSLEMVVGLLGILKAGGTYVPLDPEYPTERLNFILKDAQPRVLLTQHSLLDKLPECQAQLVCLDTDAQVISQLSHDNPITVIQTSSLAYVIYTSGSTGQPKGVQISHEAVSNFLSAMQQRPGITKQDILLGITTIAFDIAGLEIFLPLTVGASLVIAPREATLDGRQLLDLLVKSKATIMQATPATWRLLLEANYQSNQLKILCGGEALPSDLANQLLALGGSLWNLYGPTETTIWSSVCQLESQSSLISIGRAIANTQFYILDQNQQPVPVGVPGELHIGGAGLARGYLNRPELTQEKFIPNPFSKETGSRLYKTGDLARYLENGNIEYLGRIDNQVKIRGFRIELGEIETVLSQYPHVQTCCVIARCRLSFMLEDASVKVLLTQQHLRKRLPKHKAQMLCLDTNWQLLSQLSQNNLISGVQANNLAYVIYTSGSKDQPKGVAKNQLGLSNFLLWQLQNLKISKVAKTLQFAPMNSDVSFQEMFSTWCSGGTLFLTGEELHKDPLALLDFLQQQGVERLFIPFVELQQLAEVAVDNELVNNYLKEIITAGEQLQITSTISHWLSKLTDDCSLYSYYGHSESHVATTFTLTNSAHPWPLLPPIGRPIPNTQIYILDKYLQPVPVGIPGELYIGGVALARGYLNQSELTQQRFIANPFNTHAGSRLYKTGDLAHYLPDGNIKYLISIENQVKKQSFRIEWGEIEAVLSQHEHVQTCCVIAREDIRGDQRLVAYIVGHENWTPIISELRQFLKAKLPEYTLPNAFVILEEMPLTPSGKVDRRALRVIDLQNDLTEKYLAPRTPTEEMLALVWTQVLKVEQVGIHDNFFELGGHSLLATQVVSRIRSSFKVELPLREFFVAATVAQLARAIGQLQQQNLQESIPPILRRAENAELPLSFAQQRLWFLDQLESNSA